DGKFFSAEAGNKANQKIKKIAQDYNKDLLIETFAQIPADLQKDYKPENEQKRAFFEKWARDRAFENAVNGVDVLIWKSPGHLQIGVGNETRKKAFTRGNRDGMAKDLPAKCKAKKYDEGLEEAVDFYATTLKQNLGKTAGAKHSSEDEWGRRTRAGAGSPAPHSGGSHMGNSILGLVCIGVVVLLGLWLVFGLIR